MLSTFDLTCAQAQMDHQPGGAQPPIPQDARSVVLTLHDSEWREVANFARRSYHYDFDVAEDGWSIVAEPRCRPGDRNATAFANGAAISRYCVGDGIQHIQCDTKGGFWVGYFDEGVFGNYGWGDGQGGPEPIGACGLRRFTRDGDTALKYPNDNGDIADCYAMNVVEDVAWICAYTDFPIVALSAGGARKEWINTRVRGATSLAVGANAVALVGGYRGEHRRVALVKLERAGARVTKDTTLQEVFPRTDLSRFQVLARGAHIHLVDQTDWLSIAIDDIP